MGCQWKARSSDPVLYAPRTMWAILLLTLALIWWDRH
jgi:hypothetical protein